MVLICSFFLAELVPTRCIAASIFGASQFRSWSGFWPGAIGDLNGDGHGDLVLRGTAYPSTVAVLLGNGDGTFGMRSDYETGSIPSFFAIADLDGDGKPDLVTANSNYPYAGTVSVLTGYGDGSFAARPGYLRDIPLGADPTALAIADMNGDGKLDIVVMAKSPNQISVLLSGGLKMDLATDATPCALAVGDINGDGKLDLAVANNDIGASISLFLGIGNGRFGSKKGLSGLAFSDYPQSCLALADLDGDGKLDLVVPRSAAGTCGSGEVLVFPGLGDGNFRPAIGHATEFGPSFVAISDLNGDGSPDMASVSSCGGGLSVFLGRGAGAFEQEFSIAGLGLIAFGDLNGDGKPDFLGPQPGGFETRLNISAQLTCISCFAPLTTSWYNLSRPPGPIFFDSSTVLVTRNPDDAIFISGSCDSLTPWIVADALYLNGVDVGPSNGGSTGHAFVYDVPIDSNVLPTPPRNVTRFIPMGTSAVKIRLADTDRGIVGTSAIYLMRVPGWTVSMPSRQSATGRLTLRLVDGSLVRSRGRVEYELPVRGPTSLTLFSVNGGRTLQLASGELGPGTASAELHALGLSSGVYFLRLDAGGESISKRVMVLH